MLPAPVCEPSHAGLMPAVSAGYRRAEHLDHRKDDLTALRAAWLDNC
jgi:hypothetical protein